MDSSPSRSPTGNIVAACIVAAGLIGSAEIMTGRPALTSAIHGLPGVRTTVATPPITQEAVCEQFRAQVLAEPKLHVYVSDRVPYTLTNVKVTQAIYSSKDDTFMVLYNLDWQPAMVSGGASPTGSATLSNDGYGHYFGEVVIGSENYAFVTIK